MAASDPAAHIPIAARVDADPTPGMRRQQAIAVAGMWAGAATTEPHMTSGWHHHGDYDSAIFVIDGALRMESGPGGSVVFDAQPGDFIHVPKGAIHREGNPTDMPAHIVVVRAGIGPPTVNVDGPASAD